MKKFFLFVFLVILPLSIPDTNASAETVTLNTYYPAPFGSYDRLRLVPRGATPACAATSEGLLFYDDSDNRLTICQDDNTWGPLTTVWAYDNSDNVFLADTLVNPNLQVGIGTITPSDKLHVDDGNIRIQNDDTYGARITLENNLASASTWWIGSGGGFNNYNYPLGSLIFHEAGVGTGMSMDKGGNLFIGARALGQTPGSRLVVKGVNNLAASSSLSVLDSSNNSLLHVQNDGKVGVGTQSPDYPIEIEDSMHPVISFRWLNLAGRGENYFFQNGLFYGAVGSYGDNYADPRVAKGLGLTSGVNDEGFLFFRTREGNKYRDRMKIANNGNVGIGTTVPEHKLTLVDGDIGLDNAKGLNIGGVRVYTSNGTFAYVKSPSSAAIGGFRVQNFNGSADIFTVLDSGHVGIGTTIPEVKLDVRGNIRVGENTTLCNEAKEGSIRYNSGTFYGCDGTDWTPFGGSSFGSWTNRDSNGNLLAANTAIYQVTSDGFVTIRATGSGNDGQATGYTDSFTPPVTARVAGSARDIPWGVGFTLPVKRNHYWRITSSTPYNINWIPIGNGQCIKQ